ncbi:MAG: hypothetical protein ACK5FE_07940 [Cyanobacteriota bacterium]|jgi:hypothetical protein
MPAASEAPDAFAQHAPLPVTLNLELPAAGPRNSLSARFPTPGSLTSGDPHAPLSWRELLGER